MRSLFVKFFLSFLLINILFVTIGITLTFLRDREFPPLAHQHFARQAIKEYGRTAIEYFETDGPQQLTEYIEGLARDTQIRLLLFNANGQPLTPHRAPRRMRMMAHRALQSGEVVFPMMGARNWVAGTLTSPSGQTYAVAIGLPDKPKPEHLLRGLTHGYLGWRLLVLLAIAAIVCLWLARSFSAPIRRLRQATRQFATGDLSIRVADQVKGKNEIGGLARDFDHMAERIEELVDAQKQLLRDISHELRSPLARLGVALELARQNANPEARNKALQRIDLEAERMNEMIGQLLSLTRLESGTSKLRREQFDLTALLEKLVQDADFEAQNKHCRVSFEQTGPVMYYGSPELLLRACENVIRNAVKYTAENSAVSVSLTQGREHISIEIKDQGPGVPEETLEKLFEPFYRVAEARDRQSGGTGIGLAIAERAIQLHAGQIKAENLPTGGLCVRISLPSTGA